MVAEVLTLLAPCTRVVDGTLGGGGHTLALLEAGKSVIGVDRDPNAQAAAGERLAAFRESGRFTLVPATFAEFAESAAQHGAFDGVLLDLGVSSHQFDDGARGFSFREGAPLDMRMSYGPGAGASMMTARDVLNDSDEDELVRIFRDYGDEPKARRLAHELVRRRGNRPFETSDDFVGAIRAVLGPRSGPSEFARLFQALRIAVNDELGELARALAAFRDGLAPGGVFAVISYHSGEDRLVKHAFREWSLSCVCPPKQFMCTCRGKALGEVLTRKAVNATAEETARNSRARSAHLRAWQKARAEN